MKKNAFIRKTVLLLLTIISVLGLQLVSVNAKSPVPSIDKKVYIAIYSVPQSAFGKTIYIKNSIEGKEPHRSEEFQSRCYRSVEQGFIWINS